MNRLNPSKVSCRLLDAYCDGALNPREAAQFTAHLESCVACSTAIQQQQWIDELLSDSGNVEQAPIAGRRRLIVSLNRLEERRRLRRAFGGVAAAAAILLLASLVRPVGQRQQNELVEASPTEVESAKVDGHDRDSASGERGDAAKTTTLAEDLNLADRAEPDDGSLAVAEFEGRGDVIAIRVESSSPEVTVFQVFPTTDAQRRQEFAALLADVPNRSDGEF